MQARLFPPLLHDLFGGFSLIGSSSDGRLIKWEAPRLSPPSLSRPSPGLFSAVRPILENEVEEYHQKRPKSHEEERRRSVLREEDYVPHNRNLSRLQEVTEVPTQKGHASESCVLHSSILGACGIGKTRIGSRGVQAGKGGWG